MKIFHVITDLQFGGAEQMLYNVLSHDNKNSHKVFSLKTKNYLGKKIEILKIPVVDLKIFSVVNFLKAFWFLIWQIKKENPDIVKTWMYHSDLIGGIAARACGIKNIVWGIHNCSLDAKIIKKRTLFIVFILSILSWFVPKKIITCSTLSKIHHIRKGYNPKIIEVIPNGVDIKKFFPLRNKNKKKKIKKVIGFVGRYDSAKDHENLLSCLERLKEKISFSCLLAGSNITKKNKKLFALIKTKKLTKNIKMIGLQNNIPKIMNSIDIHVLPSSSEALPLVVLEAMACGTPCVVTDVGDTARIVGKTGWVVPPKCPEALADALEKACTEVGSTKWFLRKKQARNRIVDKFDINKTIIKYNAAFEQVIR